MADIYLSKEKIDELKAQLHELKTAKRIEIAERLKKAKEFGDLSENFEYSQAKEDQEKLERDIMVLENTLKNSQIITKSKNKDVVSVGLTVTLSNGKKEKASYTLVGSEEADPAQNKISNASPLGKALLGKKVGDVAAVQTPKGATIEYTILKIE
jgi:transcription elongation factor GreA